CPRFPPRLAWKDESISALPQPAWFVAHFLQRARPIDQTQSNQTQLSRPPHPPPGSAYDPHSEKWDSRTPRANFVRKPQSGELPRTHARPPTNQLTPARSVPARRQTPPSTKLGQKY